MTRMPCRQERTVARTRGSRSNRGKTVDIPTSQYDAPMAHEDRTAGQQGQFHTAGSPYGSVYSQDFAGGRPLPTQQYQVTQADRDSENRRHSAARVPLDRPPTRTMTPSFARRSTMPNCRPRTRRPIIGPSRQCCQPILIPLGTGERTRGTVCRQYPTSALIDPGAKGPIGARGVSSECSVNTDWKLVRAGSRPPTRHGAGRGVGPCGRIPGCPLI